MGALRGREDGLGDLPLLTVIETFLAENAMAWSRFGREVVGDPRFVRDLRRGRVAKEATVRRVVAYVGSEKH